MNLLQRISIRARLPLATIFLSMIWCVAPATAQLRIVTYNTANSGAGGPVTPRAGMDTILEAIGNEVRLGVAKPIDVLALQEQAASSTSTQSIVNLLNSIYGSGTYARSTLDANTLGAGRVGLIYNTQSVQLISSVPVGNVSASGASRQPVRYQLRPIGYTADADIFLYNSHYNATSASRRNVEAQNTKSNANALGNGKKVIFAGDFNIDSSSAQMYQTLLASGNGQAFDPLNAPGNWSGSSAFRAVHTQSPYDTSVGDPSLIGGGVDDRFDFQLVSGEVLDLEGFSQMAGTYRAFGNNGSHSLNGPINDPSNTAATPAVLDALASVSDHLPVVADYRLPAILALNVPTVPSRVILGSSVNIDVQVYNSAPVAFAQGADNLDYFLSGTNGILGSASGVDNALGSMPSHQLSLDTSAAGVRSATIVATTSSQDVPEDTISEFVPFTVVTPAAPSFSPLSQTVEFELDFGIAVPDGSMLSLSYAIFNLLQSSDPTANLDLDSFVATGDTSQFTTDLAVFSDLSPSTSRLFAMEFDTTNSGAFNATWEIMVSDEDLPGEQSTQMTLDVTGCVALPGDANLDGVVDGQDFIVWNENKFSGGTDFQTGDFNFDGITDGQDFIVWNENKFQSVSHAPLMVPEPTSWALLLLAIGAIGIRFKSLRGFLKPDDGSS
jgi:endonuclease/exonuclease/phosphatase family metal-dependent hydrolase